MIWGLAELNVDAFAKSKNRRLAAWRSTSSDCVAIDRMAERFIHARVGSLQMLPRRLKTDGSKMNRFTVLFDQAKRKKCDPIATAIADF